MVFGILVTLERIPSCFAKCKQRLRNIFVILSPKVIRNEKWDELYDMEMKVYNLTISSFQSYHRLKDLKLYRSTLWNFTEFGFKDLLITYPNLQT